jgi:transmembrane protease serine 9
VRYAPVYHSKNFYGNIMNPGIIRVPSFYPYPMVQQQPTFYNWQTYSYGHPSLIAPREAPSTRQIGEPSKQLAVKQAIQCGRGPATMPTSRLAISERIAGGSNAKKNVWPFVVSCFFISDQNRVFVIDTSQIFHSTI